MSVKRKLRPAVAAARELAWRVGLRKRRPWSGQAIALHEHRAVYYLVPKVACSSLTAVCVDLLGFKLPDDAWKPGVFRSDKFDDLVDTRLRDAAKVTVATADRLPGYWRFAFVRNPYDRFVSCYSEKIRDDGPEHLFVEGVHKSLLRYGVFRSGMSFEEFAGAVAEISDRDADPHFRAQTSFVCNRAGKLKVDFLGHFESLAKDVEAVGEKLGVPLHMPHLLKSKRAGWESAYTSDSVREIVRRRYSDDFRLLGYDT